MPERKPKELLWVTVLVTFAFLTLVGLLLWPATGWLVRLQLVSQILPATAVNREAVESRVAAEHSGDYQVQLARTLTAPYPVGGLPASAVKVQRLHTLSARFPDEPSVYAHALRFATQGMVLLHRTEQNELSAVPSLKLHDKIQQSTPNDLAAFDRDAASGERLDPDNAYFAMMRAVGYYEAGEDAEAIAAIHRAGQKTRYEDYANSEAVCTDKFGTLAYGQRESIARASLVAAILFPQYAQLRALSRMGTVSAVHAELNGDTEEGFAIRRDLMRTGALMRVQGHSLICNLVGIAVTAIPLARPGGISAIKTPDKFTQLTDAQRVQRVRERGEAYYSYLVRIGHPDEARWAKAETNAGVQTKAICSKAAEVGPFSMGTMLQTGLWWLANLLTLTNAIGLLILGAAAALAAAITPRTHLKLWRGLFGLAVAGMFALWLFNVERGMTNWVATPIQATQMMASSSGEDADSHVAEMLMRLGAMTLALALPLLLLLVIGILSLTMKVPLTTGLGRGLRGLALPMACLLFVLYGVLVIGTSRSEAQMNAGVESLISHEGPSMAAQIGQKWPGAVLH